MLHLLTVKQYNFDTWWLLHAWFSHRT